MAKPDYAREVLRAGQDLGITPRGIVIGFATVSVECDWIMYANAKVPESLSIPHERVGSDGKSVGLFQQQIVWGNGAWWWASAADCMDPYKSARLFFQRLAKLDYNSSARTPGWYAQKIQGSAYPDRYDTRMGEAQKLYDQLAAGTPKPQEAPAVPAVPVTGGTVNALGIPFGKYKGWIGDPTWLAEVIGAAGLPFIEHDGWRTRGHGDFREIIGVLCHHTAGGGKNDWRIVQDGRPDLAGPLAQLVLEKDGTVRIIAVGVCWHAGRGRWPGWPTDNSNWNVIGIEAVSRGTAPWDWTDVQLKNYKILCAALMNALGRSAV